MKSLLRTVRPILFSASFCIFFLSDKHLRKEVLMLNRHIVERHVGKSDFDLVTRMLTDWKDACSTITDSVSVMEKLDS